MPKKSPGTQVSVTIDPALARWLDEEADARMVGKAFLVTRALRLLRDQFAAVAAVDAEIVDG